LVLFISFAEAGDSFAGLFLLWTRLVRPGCSPTRFRL